jgi:hypothetical protein
MKFVGVVATAPKQTPSASVCQMSTTALDRLAGRRVDDGERSLLSAGLPVMFRRTFADGGTSLSGELLREGCFERRRRRLQGLIRPRTRLRE